MRCSRCGMPLSPARTSCPRCGAAVPGKTEAAAVQPEIPGWHAENVRQELRQQEAPSLWTNNSGNNMNWGLSAAGADQQSPFSESYHEPSSNNAGNWAQTKQSATSIKTPHNLKQPQTEKRELFTSRSGFTVAGSCIAAGMLILLFVFIMGSNLSSADALPQKAQVQATIAPTPTLEPTTIPSPTPTAALSGQKYFDAAQLGSDINNNTAQIVTQTNSFRLNQKIFVTFQVHTGDQIGSVCLVWTWGNHNQTAFAFPLQSSTGAAYSYMPAAATGTGKVELYYASSTACTDKVLAQSIAFSVG